MSADILNILFRQKYGVMSLNNTDHLLQKVLERERISPEEAVQLYTEADLLELGSVAQAIMLKKHPDKIVTFVIDRNINYTNICDTKCKFCAFYKVEGDQDGYVLTNEQIFDKIEETINHGGTQILMQGGTHPSLPFQYYLDLIRAIKERFPSICVHSFSPPEIVHFSKISGLSVKQVIEQMIEAGLDSIPGGGAEILVDRVRTRVSPNKIKTDQWLEVMAIAHQLGLRSTATMVFGLGETDQERIEHLDRIRRQQDETGGFTAFIPWSFQPTHTELGGKHTSAIEYLKMLAISRIYLDNINNIQASWVTQGGKMAQLALCFGGNDFGGTMLEENVVRAAGTQNKVPLKDIIHYIKDAGFTPAQRTTQYELIKIENRLQQEVDSEHDLLKQTAQHLLEAGGKRIRPIFVILAGRFGTYDFEKLSKVAIALELIHMASLVHDDVIDNAATRRGYPTVKAEWDNLTAMYTGDYILARALMIITQLEAPEIQKILAKAIVRMCEGEVEQIRDFFNIEQGLPNYLKRIRRKTALLLSVSCQLGALAAQADPKYANMLKMYGYNVGMAFQITDDILDFTATSEQLGKPAGSDLKQGNITLPVIYTLAQTEKPELANELRQLITSPELVDHIDRAIEIVKISGGIEYSQQLSDRYLAKSFAILKELPDIPARKYLHDIATFIGKREY